MSYGARLAQPGGRQAVVARSGHGSGTPTDPNDAVYSEISAQIKAGFDTLQARVKKIRRAAVGINDSPAEKHHDLRTQVQEEMRNGVREVGEIRALLASARADAGGAGPSGDWWNRQVDKFGKGLAKTLEELEASGQQFAEALEAYQRQAQERTVADRRRSEEAGLFDPQESMPDDLREAMQGAVTAQVGVSPAELELQEQLIRERNDDIQDIHKELGAIHSLYRELATEVVAQNDAINSIETNMIRSADESGQAVEQLAIASKSLEKGQKLLWIIAALTAIAVILICILIWKATHSDKDS